MNKRIITTVLLLCIGISCLFLCTTANVAGNSSQTPNALVGTLLEPDGKTPARNVKVNIRPKNTLATAGSNDTASTMTGNSGEFAFDTSLAGGIYVIEVTSGGNALFIDSIHIVKNAHTDTLPAATLKPAGAIRGVVSLIDGGDPSEVYVLAFGIDRFAEVQHDGSFIFYPIAEGNFDLRLITGLPDYNTLDKNNVEVVAAETTDIGMVQLPYTGFPVPSGIKSSFDSVSQTITVTWSRSDTALVKHYLITKKLLWGNTTLKRQIPMYDTSYSEKIDLTNNVRWEFQIAGVDKNGLDGPMSDTVCFQWNADTLIQASTQIVISQISDSISIARDIDDNIWVADYSSGKIAAFKRDGTIKTSWQAEIVKSNKTSLSGNTPYILVVDNQKHIYVENASQKCIMKYDSTGQLIGKLADSDQAIIVNLCSDNNGYIYSYIQSRGAGTSWLWLVKYDSTFTAIDSLMNLNMNMENHHNFAIQNGIFYFTSTGLSEQTNRTRYIMSVESKMSKTYYVTIDGIGSTVDANGLIYAVESPNAMWISDSGSLRQRNYLFDSNILNNGSQFRGIEIMKDGLIAICIYNKNTRSCAVHFFRRPDENR
jgi:hypothetical protein